MDILQEKEEWDQTKISAQHGKRLQLANQGQATYY